MFRWMMTPGLIVAIWIIGAIGIALYSIQLLTDSVASYFGGTGYFLGVVIFFVLAQIWLRVLLEFIAVLFRINDRLSSIDRKTP